MTTKPLTILLLLGLGISMSSCNSGTASRNFTASSINSIPKYIATTASESEPVNVLVINIDGTRADSLQNVIATLPNNNSFKTFFNHSSVDWHIYSGGRDWDSTQQQVKSDPNQTTLFTGAYCDTTKVCKNDDIHEFNTSISNLLHWYKYLQGVNSETIMIHDWHYGNELTYSAYINGQRVKNADQVLFFKYNSGSTNDEALAKLNEIQQEMRNTAIESIDNVKSSKPTIIMMHFDNPDHTGHGKKWSTNPQSNYGDAIYTILSRDLSQIADAIEKSRAKGNHWLVIFHTDHGGHDKAHGDKKDSIDTWQDTQTWAIINDCNNIHQQYCSNGTQPLEITAHLGGAYVVPTIISYLKGDQYLESGTAASQLKGLPLNFKMYHSIGDHYGSIYFRLDVNDETVDNGYPRPINEELWVGVSRVMKDADNYLITDAKAAGFFYIIDKASNLIYYYDGDKHVIKERYSNLAELFKNLNVPLSSIKNIWYTGNNNYGFLLNNNQIIYYDLGQNKKIWATSQAFSLFSNNQIKFVSYAGNYKVYYFVQINSNINVYQDDTKDNLTTLKNLGTLNDNQDISGDLTGLQVYQNVIQQAAYKEGKIYFFTKNLITDYY